MQTIQKWHASLRWLPTLNVGLPSIPSLPRSEPESVVKISKDVTTVLRPPIYLIMYIDPRFGFQSHPVLRGLPNAKHELHVSIVNLLSVIHSMGHGIKVSDAVLTGHSPSNARLNEPVAMSSWDSPTLYCLKSKGLNPEFQISLVDVFFFPMFVLWGM